MERDSLMATPTLKSNAGDQKVCKKRICHGCLVQIEKSILWDHSASSSVIFTSADKPYLTYPYPTCGIDKKMNNSTPVLT